MEVEMKPSFADRIRNLGVDDIFSPTYVYALVSGFKGAFFALEFTKGDMSHFWSIVIQLVMIEQSLILAILRAKKSNDLMQKRAYMAVWALMALFVGFGWFYQVQYLVQQTTGLHIPESFIQFYLSTLSVFAAIIGYILLEGIKVFGNATQRESMRRNMFSQRAATVRAETEWQRANAEFRLTSAEMLAGRIAGFWLNMWILGRMLGGDQIRALNRGVKKSYSAAFGQLSEPARRTDLPVPVLSGDSMTPSALLPELRLSGDSVPHPSEEEPEDETMPLCLNPACHNHVKKETNLHCGERACGDKVRRSLRAVTKGQALAADWTVFREACDRNEVKVREFTQKVLEKTNA